MNQTPPEDTGTLDFSDVLAFSIHDIKNSLSLILQSSEQLTQVKDQLPPEHIETLSRLQYESHRVNANLLQLLTLYREQKCQLPVTFDNYYIIDLYEDLKANLINYTNQKQIDVRLNLAPSLNWNFDYHLVSSVLADIFTNASRYTCSCIQLSAYVVDGYLNLLIEDDGEGYDPAMLDKLKTGAVFDLSLGRTGLGVYFARVVAEKHYNNGNKGQIKLTNSKKFGGGAFLLQLP